MNSRTLFLTGAILMGGVVLYVLFAPGHPEYLYSLTSSDGRCTGFPNGFLKWDWSACCQVHDMGGTDGQLASCLLDNTPVAATPLVFIACALMAACRPVYNFGQRCGIWK